MVRSGVRFLGSAFLVAFLLSPAAADPGFFTGLDIGLAEPTNANYRAHVHTGATANPYLGYMFNPYLGLQSQVQFAFMPADDENRGLRAHGIDQDESHVTSVFGLGLGPRLAVPAWWGDSPILIRGMEVYTTVQGMLVQGMSGRLEKTSGGLSVGGGIDFYFTDHWALSLFGRWQRAWQSPRPEFLPDDRVVQSPGEQGPNDADWATVGIGVKYDFREPPVPAAAACPECVCPKCPVTKQILLRSVMFDFDHTTIRPDSEPVLDEAIRVINEQQGNFSVILGGHTDDIGTQSYNRELSQRRADAVREYMINHGVPAEKLRAVGYGETKPVADNSTPEGRARNRRVDPNLDGEE